MCGLPEMNNMENNLIKPWLPSIGATVNADCAYDLIRWHFPWLRYLAGRIAEHPEQYRPWVFDG